MEQANSRSIRFCMTASSRGSSPIGRLSGQAFGQGFLIAGLQRMVLLVLFPAGAGSGTRHPARGEGWPAPVEDKGVLTEFLEVEAQL